MKGRVATILIVAGLICAAAAAGQDKGKTPLKLEVLWEADGFKNPESVIYREEGSWLFVSNVNGVPNEKDGNGFISKLGIDGKIEELEWVTGLDAPKGMALVQNRLYVSNIDELVEIHAWEGKISKRYPAKDAKFLNDVTADSNGWVYVSDMLDDAIYRLGPDGFELWLKDPALQSPNGLLAEGDSLIVASWGDRTKGFATSTPGHLKVVSLKDKTIKSLGNKTPVGNLDGLESDGAGAYLATDWVKGALYLIQPSGEFELLLDINSGSADLEVIPGFVRKPKAGPAGEKGEDQVKVMHYRFGTAFYLAGEKGEDQVKEMTRVFLPMMNDGKVVCYLSK